MNDNTVRRVEFTPEDNSDHAFEDDTQIKPVQSKSKDFKKILTKGEKEGKEGKAKKSPEKMFVETAAADHQPSAEIETDKDDQENASAGAMGSLFELAKMPKKEIATEPHTIPKAPIDEVKPAKPAKPQNLFAMMSGKETQQPRKTFQMEGKPIEKNLMAETKTFNKVQPPVEVKTFDKNGLVTEDVKKSKPSDYTQEQPDLSYVNPYAAISQTQPAAPIAAAPIKVEQVGRPQLISSEVKALIEDIVKHMYTVETKEKVDTVLVVDKGIFKDVTVTISTYESARGQFNIKFENLTQAAQNIIEQENNRKALFAALEEKGYNVHIMTTSTTMEAPQAIHDTAMDKERRNREESGGRQQGQQRRQQE